MTNSTPAFKALTGVATLCVALLAGPASAQWIWRGADGSTNASDRPPPPGVAEKDIIKRPAADNRRQLNNKAERGDMAASKAPGAPQAAASAARLSARAASAPPTALEREAQARKQAAEQEKAAKAKAEDDRQAAQRADNCRSARSAAASLESGIRVVRTNEKGEREVLDDKGRAEEVRRAREVIANDCR